MTSLTEKEQCKRGCTRWGAGIGLVAALLFWLIFGWGFFSSLILGIILGLVAFFVLSAMWCSKISDAPAQTTAPGPAPAPAAPAAPTATPAAAPVSSAPQSGSDATASADVGGAASEATAGTSAASASEKAAFSGMKPSTPLKGQEELAARKGSYKYEAPKAKKAPAKKAAAPKKTAAKKTAPAALADIPAAAIESKPETMAQARAGGADDLKLISGVGPKLEQTLNELGFYHFDQIAKWGPEEITWVDARVRFKGRIQRDDWVAQAATLAAGGDTEFSARNKKT
ncbi:endonuclease [uncultured Sulfitobacter sp.]|uniref:endonuclease n=1 Tax=uncultured Sulfitobacter sp. TaxID=191468 RepID=UPI0030D76AD9|tara:strand:- start:39658 stop:40512 length:855 start_codon:yes stop_codon:yes gene_type:complete